MENICAWTYATVVQPMDKEARDDFDAQLDYITNGESYERKLKEERRKRVRDMMAAQGN